MKIIVCVKVANGMCNPFDESALECALRLSDDVTVISMCPPSAKAELERLTRLCAKVILLSDSVYAGSDTLATAYILSEAIQRLSFDCILCGRQSIDSSTAQVGPMLAQMLGIPVVTNALKVDSRSSGDLLVTTRQKTFVASLPSLITVERGYRLRFPSIHSKSGTTVQWSNADVGCIPQMCGLAGSPTSVVQTFESKHGLRRCQFISRSELLSLIEQIKNEKPKIVLQQPSSKKLPNVWAIGEETMKLAENIAKTATCIDKTTPKKIAEMAMQTQPDAILWNGDDWGRKNAPITAAILKTGLCADCTRLETDGNTLFMTRPAGNGQIIAKIQCTTKPAMATVRTIAPRTELIVSAGRGVAAKLNNVHSFCEEIGATFGASRGLVDDGLAPYDKQIGLTGKFVCPKLYIAIGISGAIHHTCGMDTSGTIIAINPDKTARIFDYADYGIVDKF